MTLNLKFAFIFNTVKTLKQPLLLLLAFCLAQSLIANQTEAIKSILRSHNVTKLQSSLDSLQKTGNVSDVWWVFEREIVPQYEESICTFYCYQNQSNDQKAEIIFEYKINLIRCGDSIIRHLYIAKVNVRDTVDYHLRFDTLDSYKDTTGFHKLDQSFKTIFKTAINEKDLFDNELIYGYRCGLAGSAPYGYMKMSSYVEANDKAALVKWLQSASSQKQVYAVQGIYLLCKKGEKITPDEWKMIGYVKSKKGAIRTCSGCLHSWDEISEVTKEFKFKEKYILN
jgi:hypothetical protein